MISRGQGSASTAWSLSQNANDNILIPSFSTLIESPFLFNSVLIIRNDVSANMGEEIPSSSLSSSSLEQDIASSTITQEEKKPTFDNGDVLNNKHVGEYMKNLYVNSKERNDDDDGEDYIKKSQDLMKAIRNGKVIDYEDVSNEHLSSPRDTIVIGKGNSEIGSERFALKAEKSKTATEKPKKEKKERRESGKNDSSIIDTIFSPFYWIVGGSNSLKRNGDQDMKNSSEKSDENSSTIGSQSDQSSTAIPTNGNTNPEEKKPESSIISTIFSSSLFSSKKNSEPTNENKTEKKERKERKPKSSPLAWIERFGADAGKAASNALKDPLERLASSPVLATGEVLVVHSLDLDGIDFRRIFKYFLFVVFTWRFSNTFFGSIFPALLGRSVKRRIEQKSTPQITYLPQSPSQIHYPSISILPSSRNTITTQL